MNQLEVEKQKQYIKKIQEKQKGKQLFYHILTMGCSLNENDSEKLSGMAVDMGYIKTENLKKADLVIFNTCCIRENSEERLFGKLGEVKSLKEKKGSIIAIGGCMMQEKHILKKLNESYPYVDIIFGTHTLHRFPEYIYHAIQNKKVEDVLNVDGEIYENLPIKRESNFKAQVTIMYGCNNFCTYCIVPYVRGRERSRKKEDILEEIRNLAAQGYLEIMLLGQNVNSYQSPEQENYTFSSLLNEIDKIDGIQRIRFISPHPKDFTDEVIESIKNSDKICKIIHLPLQSGSTAVLNKMNRKYTKEQYLELVEKMKIQIPEIVFSTDIIVGFPGETEEDFEDTLDVVQKVNFEQAYMFIYSRRKGTAADKMENQIEEKVKHERFDRLKKLVDSKIGENNKKYIGQTLKVLVEGTSKNNENMLTGRSDINKIVIFEGTKEMIGKIIEIKITSDHMWYLKGNVVKIRN